jgi:hypothetical protein
MAASPSSYSLSVRDYDKELARTRVAVVPLDATNYTAWNTLLDNLQTGIAGIIIGEPASEVRTASQNTLSAALPTDQFAQRETKWIVRSEDNTTHEIFRNEIPCANLSLLSGNDEFITVFPAGPLQDFQTFWEAAVMSPDGNDVTLISLQAAGKRL